MEWLKNELHVQKWKPMENLAVVAKTLPTVGHAVPRTWEISCVDAMLYKLPYDNSNQFNDSLESVICKM